MESHSSKGTVIFMDPERRTWERVTPDDAWPVGHEGELDSVVVLLVGMALILVAAYAGFVLSALGF